MRIANLAEAETALLKYVPLVSQMPGKDITLVRMLPLMQKLDNPQDKLKTVHIAGTSGKTSTAYYMAGLLAASGKKVGLTVSPHVDSVMERVQINGQLLDEFVYCKLLGEFLDIVCELDDMPTYFELLIAFAIWVFYKQGVDYAVLETGLGGLNDGTNVSNRPDKVCIITDIGFDHMYILGNTLSEIAGQKIGIAHPGNVVFTYSQPPEIIQVFEDWCIGHKADLKIIDSTGLNIEVGIADYQKRNFGLAYEAYNYLKQRDDLPSLSGSELQHVESIQVPARMDVRQVGGKNIVMDGAHNYQKLDTFITSYKKLLPDVRPALLVSFKDRRDYHDLLPLLKGFSDEIITTVFETSQDWIAQAVDPQELAEELVRSGVPNVKCYYKQDDAFAALMQSNNSQVVITGSFYLIGQLRRKGLL